MGIAKSVAKWTNKNFTESSFDDFIKKTHSADIQSLRGKKSKGGGRPSLNSPWINLGISRSTYFRLKAKEKGK